MKNLKKDFKELNFEEIGKRLKTQREALGIAAEEVAEVIGVAPKAILNIEGARRGMSPAELYKLAQIYDISADFILLGDEAFGGENPETLKQIRGNILGTLSCCKEEELKCMEQISHFYSRALKEK